MGMGQPVKIKYSEIMIAKKIKGNKIAARVVKIVEIR
jgi:hypothetical protein